MVKRKEHKVTFDVDERTAFLKKFDGKSMKKLRGKKVKKEVKEKKNAKSPKKPTPKPEVPEETKLINSKKVIEYQDTDKVNNVQVTITTSYSSDT
jgi:hypothetical protein